MTKIEQYQQVISAAQVIQNAVVDLTPNLFVSVLRELDAGDARDMLAEAHERPKHDMNISLARWAVVVVGGGADATLSVTLSASPYHQEFVPHDDPDPKSLTGLLTINHLNRRVSKTFRPINAAFLHKAIATLCQQLGLTPDGRRAGGLTE